MDERSAKLEGGDTLAHEADEHARRFGNTGHITFHSAEEKPRPRKVADLFAKPVVRQWISGGKLYREATSRELPRIELFFDLLYVGVIRQLGGWVEESADGSRSRSRDAQRRECGAVYSHVLARVEYLGGGAAVLQRLGAG